MYERVGWLSNIAGDVFIPFIGMGVDAEYVQGIGVLHTSPHNMGMVDFSRGMWLLVAAEGVLLAPFLQKSC